MVWVQKWPFCKLLFLGNIGQENDFKDILERKSAFLCIKKRSSKIRKIDIFPKGLTHGFGAKMGILATLFFLGNIGQENVFYDILVRKNAFLGYKNKKFKKSINWHFSKGVNPRFWSKNGHFGNSFFSGNIGWGVNPWFCSKHSHFLNFFSGNISQENVFYDILEGKNAFLGCKKKKFKKSKNWHFS